MTPRAPPSTRPGSKRSPPKPTTTPVQEDTLAEPQPQEIQKRKSRLKSREKCTARPKFDEITKNNECSASGRAKQYENEEEEPPSNKNEPPCANDFTPWYRDLKKYRYGQPPSGHHLRIAKHRFVEPHEPCGGCVKKEFVNPFTVNKKMAFSGGVKRKIVEKWGKMWDSALSDLQFDRIVFEHAPEAAATYKSDKERINDGCRKLWSIARMNQNIITTMMKKFVSGPPNKLYTLNRIEAAHCWNRIIDDDGFVREECCVDLPLRSRKRYKIPSLRVPKTLRKEPGVMRKSVTYTLPENLRKIKNDICYLPSEEIDPCKKSSTYWLDPDRVPAVPEGFSEEEFYMDPKDDPTGEIRRDLKESKEVAQRYTRFAHIIEKSKQIVPNLERVNKLMDANYVVADESIRRQTLLQNFFSSQKIETSPDFKRDAMYATILSRNDNSEAAAKKQYPYNLAEFSKSKLRK